MQTENRRAFLKKTGAAGLALGALGGAPLMAQPETAAAPAMSIARWKGAQDADIQALAKQLAREAIESLGGMSRFVSKGDVVWIKPNIGWDQPPQMAANTNPDVVAELIELCLDAGAKTVKVGDNTCNKPENCYENSGIAPAARALGAEVVLLDRSRFRNHDIEGNRVREIPIYPEILDTDLVINVPIVKHHGSTRASLCMKNYMGVIEKRGVFHQDLPTCIADLTQFMKPQLCVLDAVRILTAHGPRGGYENDVERRDLVAAGTDIVALDALGAEILFNEPRIKTVTTGEEYGLGKADYKSLAPVERAVG